MATPQSIRNYVPGDDLQIVVTVSNLDPSDALVKAWLTVKASEADADPGALQKIITTTLGTSGQITADGSVAQGNGVATMNFLVLATESLALGTRRYVHDVQVKTAAGKIYTAQYGDFGPPAFPGITSATS